MTTGEFDQHERVRDAADVSALDGAGASIFPIVGVGASAGGLEAFTQLLHELPGDTGAAFVLIQHLDPKHESRLSDLLSRVTAMPVTEATDGLAVRPEPRLRHPSQHEHGHRPGRLAAHAPRGTRPAPAAGFFLSVAGGGSAGAARSG